MTTKFTPGPWSPGWGTGLTGPTTPSASGVVAGGEDWPTVPVRKGRETIAIVPKQDGNALVNAKGAASAEDNANLIAAAPDLYEALACLLEAHGHAYPSRKAMNKAINKATDDAQMALAKARGEA